jgi:hypothetical protein
MNGARIALIGFAPDINKKINFVKGTMKKIEIIRPVSLS